MSVTSLDPIYLNVQGRRITLTHEDGIWIASYHFNETVSVLSSPEEHDKTLAALKRTEMILWALNSRLALPSQAKAICAALGKAFRFDQGKLVYFKAVKSKRPYSIIFKTNEILKHFEMSSVLLSEKIHKVEESLYSGIYIDRAGRIAWSKEEAHITPRRLLCEGINDVSRRLATQSGLYTLPDAGELFLSHPRKKSDREPWDNYWKRQQSLYARYVGDIYTYSDALSHQDNKWLLAEDFKWLPVRLLAIWQHNPHKTISVFPNPAKFIPALNDQELLSAWIDSAVSNPQILDNPTSRIWFKLAATHQITSEIDSNPQMSQNSAETGDTPYRLYQMLMDMVNDFDEILQYWSDKAETFTSETYRLEQLYRIQQEWKRQAKTLLTRDYGRLLRSLPNTSLEFLTTDKRHYINNENPQHYDWPCSPFEVYGAMQLADPDVLRSY